MRMKFYRILPDTWASTWCLFSSSTRNMALGSGSITTAITSIASSLLIRSLKLRLTPYAIRSTPIPWRKAYGVKRRALLRQDHRTVARDRHAMLKVCADAAVLRDGGPAVFQNSCLGLAGVHHRFDGDDHAFAQPGAVPAGTEVRDLRVLVEPRPDTVSDEFADHAEAVGFHQFLHRRSDIAHSVADARRFDAAVQRVSRDRQQLLDFRLQPVADRHRHCRIAVEAVEHHAAVDGNNVSRVQLALLRRDAVHDLVIDRGAQAAGIVVIPLESRLGPELADLLLGRALQIHRGDPGPNQGRGCIQHLPYDPAGAAHLVDLRR